MTPRPPAGAPSTKQTIIKRYAKAALQFAHRSIRFPEEPKEMARRGEEFVVEDTTTGEDITHLVGREQLVSH